MTNSEGISIKINFNGRPKVSHKPVSLIFVLGMLMFFLPFFEMKCNNQSLMTVSGTDMVVGIEKPTILGRKMQDDSADVKPNPFAIAALVCALTGAISIWVSRRYKKWWGAASGLAALLLMVLIYIGVKHSAEKQETLLQVVMKPGFYLASFFFLLGAGLSLLINPAEDVVNPVVSDFSDSEQRG